MILLTETCMYRCRMCSNWKLGEDPAEMTLADWKGFFSDLRGMLDEPIEVNMGGGEPLQKPWAFDLIEYAASLGFPVSLVTNGALVTDEAARRIGDSGLHNLAMSLDGMSAEVHDQVRGVNGSFKQIHKALERLERHAPEVQRTLQWILMAPNLHQIEDLLAWVEGDARIDALFTMAVMHPHHEPPMARWYEHPDYADLWPRDHARIDSVVDQLLGFADGRGKVANPGAQLETFRRFFHDPERFVKDLHCTLGDYALHVNARGEVFICMNLDAIGNVKQRPLSRLWYGDDADRVRTVIPVCDKNCEFLVNCYFEEEHAPLPGALHPPAIGGRS